MNKRWLACILALCMLAGVLPIPLAQAAGPVSVWDGSVADGFAGGQGTQERPYRIETAAQLAYLAKAVNEGDTYVYKYFSLETDIDLSGIPWTPIGTNQHTFAGIFQGNAFTIFNLYINAQGKNFQGVFGHCLGSISNLCLSNASVIGQDGVGTLAGYAKKVTDCNVSGSVQGESVVGGVIGSGNAYRCINHATVLGNKKYVGGIMGGDYPANIYKGDQTTWGECTLCVNDGYVDSYGSYVGGIVGTGDEISACFNAGQVGGHAEDRVGGVGGYATYISGCANIGSVLSGKKIGGLAGTGFSVLNSYNAGPIAEVSAVAGSIVGASELENGVVYRVQDCYALQGTATYLVGSADYDGAAFLDAVNTADFAALLNRNSNDATWLQDPAVYDGYPYFEPRTVLDIVVTTAPTKTAYKQGEFFEPWGIVVSALCSDGSTYELSPNSLTYYPTGALEPGTTAVKVFYGQMQTETPITVEADRFTDVAADSWCRAPVEWAVDQEITNGTGENTFSPDVTCSVAQILTFLWRANNRPAPLSNPFDNVAGTEYYAKAIAWAYENGLISDTHFEDGPCTRSMVVEYLWKLAGSPTVSGPTFEDIPLGAAYTRAVTWAVEQSITSGTGGGNFSPDMTCTRGQIVTFLFRAYHQ